MPNYRQYMRAANFNSNWYRPTTGYFCGIFASMAYRRLLTSDDNFYAGLGASRVSNRIAVAGTTRPAVNVLTFPDFTLIAIEGTTNQWVKYLRDFVFFDSAVILNGIEFRISSFFIDHVNSVLGYVRSLAIDKPIVLCGHSLGGAVASAAGLILKRQDGKDVIGIYSYGSPKIFWRLNIERYNVRHWRHVTENDPVPSFPPLNFAQWAVQHFASSNWYVQLDHTGERVHLPDLDYPELITTYGDNAGVLDQLIERTGVDTAQHYMCAYVESLYGALSKDGREYCRDMEMAMVRAKISTTPDNIPEFLVEPSFPAPEDPGGPPIAPPPRQQRQAEIASLIRAETAFLRQSLAAGEYAVHLFTDRVSPDRRMTPDDFVEADFPGYHQIPTPQSMKVVSSDEFRSYSDTATVVFNPVRDLPEAVYFKGVFVTSTRGGETTLIGFKDFQTPLRLQAASDKISVLIQFTAAELSDAG